MTAEDWELQRKVRRREWGNGSFIFYSLVNEFLNHIWLKQNFNLLIVGLHVYTGNAQNIIFRKGRCLEELK